MRRQHVQLEAPMSRGSGDVLALGHYGRPVLAFPPAGGRAWEFDDNGMIDAVSDLLEAGRMKVYCVDGRETDDAPTRAAYEAWVIDRVLPFVYADCGGPLEVLTAGCADGAVTAVDLALRRADLFPVAIAMSGRYDDEAVDAVARLGHDHVDWLGGRLTVVLGVADDADTAAAEAFGERLADLGIRHELDRVPAGMPGSWPAWRHLAATHLPRFC
jgi:esterase/lipase superfamily enzyme